MLIFLCYIFMSINFTSYLALTIGNIAINIVFMVFLFDCRQIY